MFPRLFLFPRFFALLFPTFYSTSSSFSSSSTSFIRLPFRFIKLNTAPPDATTTTTTAVLFLFSLLIITTLHYTTLHTRREEEEKELRRCHRLRASQQRQRQKEEDEEEEGEAIHYALRHVYPIFRLLPFSLPALPSFAYSLFLFPYKLNAVPAIFSPSFNFFQMCSFSCLHSTAAHENRFSIFFFPFFLALTL